jgi:hypothetical protein
MMRASEARSKRKRHAWRFRGITADSLVLGVNRSHLYRVLSKKRTSPRLEADYRALKESQRQADKNSSPKI